MSEARCRGKNCGRPIVWGRTPEGKKIPLDPAAPVYKVGREDGEGGFYIERTTDAMVSHFKTCPDAGAFGKGGRGG